MNISLDKEVARFYISSSQKSRVLTEDWVNREVFCPACGYNIRHYENNRPVADFYCSKCSEDYELKSKKDGIGNKIVDGAYRTMIERLQTNKNPNFFLLNYNLRSFEVLNLLVIPKHFFVPHIIEERKPLSQSARRAGWVGCNISLQNIPQTGKIYYIKDKQVESKEEVLRTWKKTLFLREEKETPAKGWVLDIMNCIDKLGKRRFNLEEVYFFKEFLGEKHPQNRHIKDKIRQQLQFLRDKGYLRFIARGEYELT
ncbi:MAG: restriction endonuclease [Candidatus Omnitrophica bacterium]|nr:restriction endonuclease [Candidatus Omnitrophota bacterium]